MKKKTKSGRRGTGGPRDHRHTDRGALKKAHRAAVARSKSPAAHRPATTCTGVFSAGRGGYGFVTWEGHEDVFIPACHTAGALHGDTVRVRIRDAQAQRPEGEVIGLVEAKERSVIGTLCRGTYPRGRGKERGWVVIPDDARLPDEIAVLPPPEAREGDKVAVIIERRGRGAHPYTGRVSAVFGSATDLHANYEAILAETGVQTDFSPEVLREAEEAAAAPLCEEGRMLPQEVIFTIDGADAKDLDDAVSLTRLPGGKWHLGVHIADVSHYVTPHTALDRAATERGSSVYFTDRVVPMLPTALSNGACSLTAGEDKYALSAYMTLASDGAIVKTEVYRSLIRSRVRGVYSEVNDVWENGAASPFHAKYRPVLRTLARMKDLYAILSARAKGRGMLELEENEAQILLNEKGHPVDIVRRERGVAERMIEQFMLTANEGVATLLHQRGVPCVYRQHDTPPAEKLEAFLTYARGLGLSVSCLTEHTPTGADFSAVLREAQERGIGSMVSYTLLRTMAKAQYSEVPSPHFGLGIPLYCHFTSPIRRLSDLATHRMLKAVLLDGAPAQRYRDYAARAAEAANEGEIRAITAERRIEALYKALYMQDRLGEEFPAVISSVTSFGLFAELENTCEGLIPVQELNGIFTYEETTLTLSCGRTRYRLGDRIRVRVEEVEVCRGRVRFALLGREEET